MREALGPERVCPTLTQGPPTRSRPHLWPHHPPARPLPANHGPVAPILFDRVHFNLIFFPAKIDICLIDLLHCFPCGHRRCALTTPDPSPSPLAPVRTLFLSSNMVAARRASESFPSKILLTEESSTKKNFNAFHVHSTSQPDMSFHIHFFWDLVNHLWGSPAQTGLGGGFVG